jgi:hypothetical protein
MSTATKHCSRCGSTRPVEEFNRDRGRKDGRHPVCRPCIRDYRIERREKDRATMRAYYEGPGRARELMRRYGLTVDDVDRMLEAQAGACAVCGHVPIDDDPILVVDHDHATGHVRGMLCRPCNSGIGHLRDDPELIRAALAYLEGGTT